MASREVGFSAYYLAKNVGVLLAPIICGIIGSQYGYHYAFFLGSIGMFSGVIVFAAGKHKLSHDLYSHTTLGKRKRVIALFLIYVGIVVAIPLLIDLFIYNINALLLCLGSIGVLIYFGYIMRGQTKKERRNMGTILFVLLMVIIFTLFLGQGGAVLNLFIERITDRHIFGFLVPTPEFYALDPLFMLLMGPFVISLLSFLSRRRGSTLLYPRIIGSLFILGLGFLVFLLAARHAEIYGHSSSLYIVFAYMIFPISELLLFPTALSAITKYSPKHLSSMMMGIFRYDTS